MAPVSGRRMCRRHELMRRWPQLAARARRPRRNQQLRYTVGKLNRHLPCALQNATLHDEKATQVEQDEDLLNIVLGAPCCAVLRCAVLC